MFLGKKKKREKLHVKISPNSALFKKAVENVGKRQSAGRQSLNGSENWPKPSSPFATAKHDLTLSPSPPSSSLESHLYPGEGDGKEGSKQASKQEGWRRRNTSGLHPHHRTPSPSRGRARGRKLDEGVTRLWLR